MCVCIYIFLYISPRAARWARESDAVCMARMVDELTGRRSMMFETRALALVYIHFPLTTILLLLKYFFFLFHVVVVAVLNVGLEIDQQSHNISRRQLRPRQHRANRSEGNFFCCIFFFLYSRNDFFICLKFFWGRGWNKIYFETRAGSCVA